LGGREWRLRQLTVRRRVEYRTGPSDNRDRYPLTLSEGEYFLVGDNVPISRDSRHWGGVGGDRIVGRVEIASL
jgi:type IV secretory pathway protease TraF